MPTTTTLPPLQGAELPRRTPSEVHPAFGVSDEATAPHEPAVASPVDPAEHAPHGTAARIDHGTAPVRAEDLNRADFDMGLTPTSDRGRTDLFDWDALEGYGPDSPRPTVGMVRPPTRHDSRRPESRGAGRPHYRRAPLIGAIASWTHRPRHDGGPRHRRK